MSFQSPAAILPLIPLAAVLIALYLLKMRRRELRVPASFLWPAQVEEVRANALFQRLRFNWLLVLQLLALTMLMVVLGRPQCVQSGLTGDVTVIVLDGSASMGATDAEPTRFEAAKRQARDAIRSLGGGDRLALIFAGTTPTVVFSLGNDPPRQLRSLDKLSVSEAPADVGEALRLASALVSSQEGARIVLLSDGAFPPVLDFSPGKAAFIFRGLGKRDENVAIRALSVSQTANGRLVFAGLRNHGSVPMKGTLTLRADGELLDSVELTIPANGAVSHTKAAPLGAALFEATLRAPDLLKADNYAASVSGPAASIRVLLVTAGNPFLERALSQDPRVTLDKSIALTSDAGAAYDLVLFDNSAEERVLPRTVLTFGKAGTMSPVRLVGKGTGAVVSIPHPSPLLEGVDLPAASIDEYQRVRLAPGAKVLADAGEDPIVVLREQAGLRQLYVAFEPLSSDFPLQVGFPIFIANVLDWVAGGGVGNILALRTGQSFSLPSLTPAKLIAPDGSTVSLQPAEGAIMVPAFSKTGRHSLESGPMKKAIHTWMQDDAESQITPNASLSIQGGEAKSVTNPTTAADFFRPILLLCLAVLAFEWWLFARRS